MILNMATLTLTHAHKTAKLTRLQADVLAALAQSNRPLSHYDLARVGQFRDRDSPQDMSRMVISRIRNAAKHAGMPDLIKTTRNHGYSLRLPVKITGADPAVLIPADIVPSIREIVAQVATGRFAGLAGTREAATRILAALPTR